jgi:hypothetical protein
MPGVAALAPLGMQGLSANFRPTPDLIFPVRRFQEFSDGALWHTFVFEHEYAHALWRR